MACHHLSWRRPGAIFTGTLGRVAIVNHARTLPNMMKYPSTAPKNAVLRAKARSFKPHLFSFERWRVGHRLIALVVAIALPLNILIVAAIAGLAGSAIEAQRTTLLFTTRSVASAVDAQLAKYVAIAADLQKSSSLSGGDLAAFEAEARQTLTGVPDAWVAVSDVSGQQLINTSPRAARPLPRRNGQALRAQQRAFNSHSIIVTGVRRGTAVDDWIATVEAPVFKGGEPFRVVSVAMRLPAFLTVLGELETPKAWFAGIIDGDGRYVARVPDNDSKVGQLASEGWRRVQHEEGVFEFPSLDGDMVVSASARSKLGAWTVGIALQKSELTGAAW